MTDGRIAYAGPAAGAPAAGPDDTTIDAIGGTIMPGLVEAHFHATYFNVQNLEDLDIKYPAEMCALQAVVQHAGRPRLRLHLGPLRRVPVQRRRVAHPDDRRRPRRRAATRAERTGDLRQGRVDGLEPRLPAHRDGGSDPRHRRTRLGPLGRPPARQERRPVDQDLPHRRRRRAGVERSAHAVDDPRGDGCGGRGRPQPPAQGVRPLPGDARASSGRWRSATTRSSTARTWTPSASR